MSSTDATSRPASLAIAADPETRPAADDSVTYRVEKTPFGPIAHVQLNRPDKHNGLTLPLLAGLTRAARQAAKDRTLRAVIISGAGKSFSAGLDFASLQGKEKSIYRNFIPNLVKGSNGFQDPAWEWRRVPVPVIAVVHGHCYGGGLQIAMGADFRFATPDADFSVLEAKWGLIPDMSASAALAQLTTIDIAKRLTMTGEMFSADHAKEIGLVTGVAEDPMAEAMILIEKIASRSPDSVASTKSLLEKTWSRSPRFSFPVEQVLQLRLLRGKNHAIARKAGMKRTTPEFVDREL
jgi:enoyl-CoA hydratase/carnithine racemase